MSNLELWDKVKKTDPTYTKEGKKGAFKFTSIAPVYQTKMATEVFGVQGIKWGVVVGSESFTESNFGDTTILSYDAVMFFIYEGERGEIPIHASEKAAYKTNGENGYFKVDDEVRKKVVTNAKTKGLSELGFNADVFMGEFDDPDYVAKVYDDFALEKAEDKIEEKAKQDAEYEQWLESAKETLAGCVSMNELKKVFAGMVRKAQLYKDDTAIRDISAIKDKRKAELEA